MLATASPVAAGAVTKATATGTSVTQLGALLEQLNSQFDADADEAQTSDDEGADASFGCVLRGLPVRP